MENKIIEVDGKFLVKCYDGYGNMIHKEEFETKESAEAFELKTDEFPAILEPEVTEQEVTEQEVTEQEVTESEVTESEVTESEVTESEVTEQEVTEQEVTESEVKSLKNNKRNK